MEEYYSLSLNVMMNNNNKLIDYNLDQFIVMMNGDIN